MKDLKRFFSLGLALTVILTATACANKPQEDGAPTTTWQYIDAVVDNTESSDGATSSEILESNNQEAPSSTITVSPGTTQNATGTTAPSQNTQTTAETQSQTQKPSEEVPQITDGVGKYTSTYISEEQAVYYPADLISSGKTYPIVAFANGTAVSYTFYESLLKELAKCGYIVVGNSETMAGDGTAQRSSIDFIISENSNPSSVLYGRVNTEKIAAVGHSQGGRGAVNAAAADSRIDCVLSIAGSNYVEEAEKLYTPALFMAGTKDWIVNADQWVKTAYDASKGPAVYINNVGATHTTCCSNPAPYVHYASLWFDAHLNGNTSQLDKFRNGGELSNDSAWSEFSCKGF